jgi:hypothetical protein
MHILSSAISGAPEKKGYLESAQNALIFTLWCQGHSMCSYTAKLTCILCHPFR